MDQVHFVRLRAVKVLLRRPNHNQAYAFRYRLSQSGYFLRGGLLASSHQQAWSRCRLECNRLPPIDALP